MKCQYWVKNGTTAVAMPPAMIATADTKVASTWGWSEIQLKIDLLLRNGDFDDLSSSLVLKWKMSSMVNQVGGKQNLTLHNFAQCREVLIIRIFEILDNIIEWYEICLENRYLILTRIQSWQRCWWLPIARWEVPSPLLWDSGFYRDGCRCSWMERRSRTESGVLTGRGSGRMGNKAGKYRRGTIGSKCSMSI